MAIEPRPKPDKKGESTLKVCALRLQRNHTDRTEDNSAENKANPDLTK